MYSPIRLSSQLRLFNMEKREMTGGSSGSLLLERSKLRRTFDIRSNSLGNWAKQGKSSLSWRTNHVALSETHHSDPRFTSINIMLSKLHAPVLVALSMWRFIMISFLFLDMALRFESLITLRPDSVVVNSTVISPGGPPVLDGPCPICLLQHGPITPADPFGKNSTAERKTDPARKSSASSSGVPPHHKKSPLTSSSFRLERLHTPVFSAVSTCATIPCLLPIISSLGHDSRLFTWTVPVTSKSDLEPHRLVGPCF